MLVLNSLFPVFFLISLGVLLRYRRTTGDAFLKTSDQLVYFIFFPGLLFWKIGSASLKENIYFDLCTASLAAVILMFAFSLLCIRAGRISDFRAGTFSQSCYRFNTYIGMAVISTAYGDAGIRCFGILIAFVIPVINVLAVSTLIWYSGRRMPWKNRLAITGRALIANPLIIACIAGLCHARIIGAFPVFLENTFRLMTSVTLPLALLSIGGSLHFNTMRRDFILSLAASAVKLVLFPAAGFFILKMFHIKGLPFQVAMIFFSLPTATSIYILSSQLNSDTKLASASIVLSTLLSFFSMTAALML